MSQKTRREYENGCKLVRTGRSSGLGDYVVHTGDGRKIDYPASTWYVPRVFAALDALYGPFPVLDDPDIVPVEIATAGMPAITGYLYSVHRDQYGFGPNEKAALADRLDIQRETVSKYSSRILEQARDHRV